MDRKEFIKLMQSGNTLTARQMFKQKFKGNKNFMTPNIARRGKINPIMSYEISYGRGLTDSNLYGVTILVGNSAYVNQTFWINRDVESLSCAHNSMQSAEDYIEWLKIQFPTMQDTINYLYPESPMID